jgi:ABC-type metal ion transport system substrate-binding protein
MELIVTLAMKFWQWTVLIAVVIIAAIINKFDKKAKTKLKFSYTELPHLQPLRIATKDKGFWKGIVMWLLSTRKRADEIFRDININVNGFYTMNYLAYWSLRLGGFVAWNGHRKRNAKIEGIK